MIKMKSRSWMAPDEVVKAVRQAQVKSLDQAAALVESTMKRKLSVGGQMGKGKARHTVRSRPGEPPRAQTGNLMSSVAWARTLEETRLIGPQSPPAHYGAYLEYGTRKMEPRPFARPSLTETSAQYASLWRNLPLSRTPAGRALNRRKS